MRKRVVSTGSLFVAIVSMVFIVFFNHQTAASANIVSSAIYALEDTTIVYEGIDSGKIMYEDEGLGYLNIGYQGGYGSPIEVQSKLTKLLNHTIPEIHPKPTLAPFDFTSHISEENLKTNPTATFILSVLSAEEARSADIPTKEHYIQTTDITYTEIEDIEITGVVNDGIYNTNVTPLFYIGTATLNGASFSSGTTITVEGSYTLVVTDGSLSKTLQFEIDKTPPTATVLINNGSYFTNHQFVDVTITPDPGVDDIVRMRYSVNSSQVSTTQLYYSQFSIGVGSDNGDKSVRVELIDAAGNISPLYFWNFSMNTTIPTGTLTINSGAAYTTEREVDLLITPDVGANEIVSMQFSADNNNWSSVEGYSPSKRYTLPTGDGDKTVFVRLIDRFGNIGVIQRSILLNTKPPTASVLINNGNVYTNNANVVVAITPDVGVNDIAFIRYMINSSTPTTIPYIDSFVINVGNTNEEKEITVTLISGGGNISPIYSSTIILDTLEPTGTVAINGGAAYAASTGVTLTFTLGADVTDVEGVQFSNDNVTWSTEEAYSPSMSYNLSAGEGSKTVYVRFIDRAGNVSEATSASIIYRTIPEPSHSTGHTSEVASTENPVSADVMIKFGEYELEGAFTGQVHVQGSSIEILLSKAQLTHLSKTHENQTIEVSLMGTYSKSQLIVSNEALDKLAANSNSLLFKTTGQQFLLSSQELKQMLATNHSSYVISIKHESEGMFAQAKEQAQKGAYQLIGVPITIDLLAQNEDNSLHLQELGTIVLGSTGTGELPSAVLKLLDNGVQSPVTAAISVNNQSYYAKVTSYGSGTYMLIRKQPRFTDVSGWSLKAIDTLSSKLILSGVNETTFEPKRAITRAEFATIISKALGLVETSGSLNYTDVVTGAWYSDAVATVAELGFMNGYPDTTYRPTQKITREEAMVIVARVLHHLDSKKVLSDSEIDRVLGEYSDQAQISIWSRNDIASSVQEGIIMGINGKLAVKDQITREQVAAMIVRLLEHAEIL
ncbi:S-layer homology domain-containing protein [Paenibacillus taichungensis]|uniref:S-layer homology domain-containing protein n=1 Tax=Paenibacillus taichungensis TaxID=484184 RepID=UPI002870CDA9|nr:S-layer homology domain-containing protein [Paenibacillus taichungensis]MDR9746045.1 S-layer homology domain-containing protein [Paenibacillus taichungensis]